MDLLELENLINFHSQILENVGQDNLEIVGWDMFGNMENVG